MSFAQEDINVVFNFLRARTVDDPKHLLPRHVFMRVMRGWAADHGYSACPNGSMVSAILQKAGYPTVRGDRHQVIRGLNLAPKADTCRR